MGNATATPCWLAETPAPAVPSYAVSAVGTRGVLVGDVTQGLMARVVGSRRCECPPIESFAWLAGPPRPALAFLVSQCLLVGIGPARGGAHRRAFHGAPLFGRGFGRVTWAHQSVVVNGTRASLEAGKSELPARRSEPALRLFSLALPSERCGLLWISPFGARCPRGAFYIGPVGAWSGTRRCACEREKETALDSFSGPPPLPSLALCPISPILSAAGILPFGAVLEVGI